MTGEVCFKDDGQNRSPVLYFWVAPQSTRRLLTHSTLHLPHVSAVSIRQRKWATSHFAYRSAPELCSYKRAALTKSTSFEFYSHLSTGFRVQCRCSISFRIQLVGFRPWKAQRDPKLNVQQHCSILTLRRLVALETIKGVREEMEEGNKSEEWSFSIPLHGCV